MPNDCVQVVENMGMSCVRFFQSNWLLLSSVRHRLIFYAGLAHRPQQLYTCFSTPFGDIFNLLTLYFSTVYTGLITNTTIYKYID